MLVYQRVPNMYFDKQIIGGSANTTWDITRKARGFYQKVTGHNWIYVHWIWMESKIWYIVGGFVFVYIKQFIFIHIYIYIYIYTYIYIIYTRYIHTYICTYNIHICRGSCRPPLPTGRPWAQSNGQCILRPPQMTTERDTRPGQLSHTRWCPIVS